MATHTFTDLPSTYGENVFSDCVMRERLPKKTYEAVRRAMDTGTPLALSVADVVANAMKDWAIEKGATHFCHWFQPMTGMTAEKHDSFISPTMDGRIIMEFSGKELVRGEPDASSFPSGGLRATFEARGYTAWDCTSPVFVKADGTNVSLFIPSAFCSYRGEALDKKTPLLRSMDALNRQALRVLRALGNATTRRVMATLGAEQEYFLIDERFARKRLDLAVVGRTLFGAPPPKGQEMDDHYFGTLDERVASFMADLNTELWKLGIAAKTQHNEVAPAQYELAPIFATANVATDGNQVTMQAMQKIARRHGFVCLLHEKPFAGVNGSGKHNNWSPDTDDGIGLLRPGSTPHANMQFLVFLFAVIRAVDRYAPLLRATAASPGNDLRLGANEAPPAIVSIFLGDQLTDIYEQLEAGGARSSKEGGELTLGVSTLPPLPKDSTDRNRTSPFAFTGSKFEFRMVGSTQSTSGACFVLNTIVAESLREIADVLEQADDVPAATQELLQQYAREHRRIIFNGDNYTAEWAREAARRGLPNISNTVDSIASVSNPDAIDVLQKHGVLSEGELRARQEILFENYSMVIGIEARTALQMTKRQILPAAVRYAGRLAQSVTAITAAGVACDAETDMLREATELNASLRQGIAALEAAVATVQGAEGAHEVARLCRDCILPAMARVRAATDALEAIVDADLWPLPTYADMLFTH